MIHADTITDQEQNIQKNAQDASIISLGRKKRKISSVVERRSHTSEIGCHLVTKNEL